MVTHIIGGGIGVLVLLAAVLRSSAKQEPWAIVSSSVYGASMTLLYAVSSVYHGLHPSLGKKVMQAIDHCMIYFLIVGTYMPILFVSVRSMHPILAWVIFGAEWAFLALAVTFTAIDHKKYRVLSMAAYIGMGWCIIAIVPAVIETMGWSGFAWLLGGGIAYTVGAVLYGVGKKKPVMHTVFHVFVVLGSVLQAIAILFYVLV